MERLAAAVRTGRFARLTATTAVIVVAEQIHAAAVTQVALGRTTARAVQAFGAHAARVAALAAMTWISFGVDARAVTRNRSFRATTLTVRTCLTQRASIAAPAAVLTAALHVDALARAGDASARAQALPTRAALSRRASGATGAAILTIIEYVDASIAAVSEAGTALALPVTATFGGAAHVAAFAAMRWIVLQAHAVTVAANRGEARAGTHTLVAHAQQIAAVVATLTAVVVIGAQVHTKPTTQASASWAPARARDALLTFAAGRPTVAAVAYVAGDVYTGPTTQSFARSTVTSTVPALRPRRALLATSTAVGRIVRQIRAAVAAQRQAAIATTPTATTYGAFCTDRAASAAVCGGSSKIGAGRTATIGALRVLHAWRQWLTERIGWGRQRLRVEGWNRRTCHGGCLGLRDIRRPQVVDVRHLDGRLTAQLQPFARALSALLHLCSRTARPKGVSDHGDHEPLNPSVGMPSWCHAGFPVGRHGAARKHPRRHAGSFQRMLQVQSTPQQILL